MSHPARQMTKTNLKIYQILLATIIFPICLFMFASNGWSAYSTITQRQGLNGSMYSYYDLTRIQFSLYTGFVSLSGFLFSATILLYSIQKDSIKLNKTFRYFLLFCVMLIVCELYLQTRFIGKG